MRKLWSRIANLLELEVNESEIGRILFFHLKPWTKMINVVLKGVNDINFMYVSCIHSIISLLHLQYIYFTLFNIVV